MCISCGLALNGSPLPTQNAGPSAQGISADSADITLYSPPERFLIPFLAGVSHHLLPGSSGGLERAKNAPTVLFLSVRRESLIDATTLYSSPSDEDDEDECEWECSEVKVTQYNCSLSPDVHANQDYGIYAARRVAGKTLTPYLQRLKMWQWLFIKISSC